MPNIGKQSRTSREQTIGTVGVKPFRILAIVPSAFCFGLQNITLALFERISKEVPCHFLVTKWNDGEFPGRLRKLNIPFTEAWLGMFSRKLDWRNLRMTIECLIKLPSAYVVFARLFRRFQPTCIFLANHHEAILLWPMLLFQRKKVACHLHDAPPAIPFQKASYRIWRTGIGRFIFISQSARERMAELGPIHQNDAVIWNGVEIRELIVPRKRTDRFCTMFGWPADSLIVGLTGQMTPTKGHEDFIAAAALVARANPKARFVIGGKSIEPYFSTLRAQIAAEGLPGVIEFSGWAESASDFFDGIDLFVLASRHDEGFGLVLAEAGERGLASVATRSGGATEIIVDGETGILVKKTNPDEMASAILKLLEDEQLRQETGGRARARVIEFFNLDRQAEKIKAFLAGI
jgi:glycosyltransferase involved in cell wall biosynthesis